MTSDTGAMRRFDDLSGWLREQIGLARSAQRCDASARSLLEDAERELDDVKGHLAEMDGLYGAATVTDAGADPQRNTQARPSRLQRSDLPDEDARSGIAL